MKYKVGERLDLDGELCTLRYIGAIPDWPGQVAYGVEWDSQGRGKHSGTLHGVKYFETSRPDTGSFLKESRVLKTVGITRTLLEALHSRYGEKLLELDEMYIGSKRLEGYGFEKLTLINNDYLNLKVLSLSKLGINRIGSDEDLSNFVTNCSNVEELDITSNLFIDFGAVISIASNLRKLRTLDVSNNKFSITGGFMNQCLHVKRLIIRHCRLDVTSLRRILEAFPNLENLDVLDNSIDDIDSVKLPKTLKTFNVSQNTIKSWQSQSLKGLQTLIAANNIIADIPPDPCPTIRTLDLSYNNIALWDVVDKFQTVFPNMHDLRINNNIFSSDEEDTDEFYQIIARIPSLTMLEGSILGKDTRREAELYFISKVRSGDISYDCSSIRWKSLLYHHGISDNSTQNFSYETLWHDICVLEVHFEGKQLELHLLNTSSVRLLKNLIAQLLDLDLLAMSLSYSITPGIVSEFNYEFSPLTTFGIRSDAIVYVNPSDC
ncbi:ADR009Wp [Eremothecium gossypii ATCC 10895]|uniref:ADR009Wp n=1 Tax=Eremothecium gossypii (strain ATCC 10895 / CBS 109.51 / FGSC 9923 / NRRL Y-1056) TaxID=284811 RepID=Q75AA9_EREGS|nr:ADR009Wp [Eremothecium gossypii ATCC 10895]AAS51929.1 ADR009Wp [Eremothecium gossypii ATCC 10895]AEY96229.1 FADR009Wp [Eremothecium gossypii FDAG1]